MSAPDIYMIVVIIASIISAAAGLYALRFRHSNPLAIWFTPMMLAVSEWIITSWFVCSSNGDYITMLWIRARYAGLMLMVPFFAAFTLQYTGRTRHMRLSIPLVFTIPLLSIIITATDDLHHLMIQSIHYSWDGPVLYVDMVRYGGWFWIHTIYSYLVVLVCLIMLGYSALRGFKLYRHQSICLIAGIVPAVIASVIDAFLLLPEFKHALSPIGFAIMGLFFFYGIFRHGMLTITPVARHQLIETMADGMLVLDTRNLVVDINPAARSILGISSADIIGKPLPEIISHPQKARQDQENFGKEIRIGQRVFDLRTRPIPKNKTSHRGTLLTLTDITRRVQLEKELIQKNESLSVQLSEISQLHKQLQQQVIRDPLTGLFNRRYLDESLPREISLALREETPLGFLLLDIDHFKQVNDTHGHACGDMVLRETGTLLPTLIRGGDLVFRYGGEEFLLILVNSNLESSIAKAETIRQALAGYSFIWKGARLKITVSAGVATLPTHGITPGALFAAADEALYLAKRNGRNRVCCPATTAD